MSNPTIYDQATSAVVKMLETAGTNWHQPFILWEYGVHSSNGRIWVIQYAKGRSPLA